MTTKQALKTLREFNAWRRGDDKTLEQPHPKAIGEAIDHAIKELSKTKTKL